nr:M23 family metallopeptidase [Nocardioides sp. KC13]
MPVTDTYVTSPYGIRKHPIYGYVALHNGTDYHAPCGRPLLAIESGQIISTSFSSVWGNRLHLYLGKVNGHSYTAVYNHISSYARRSGNVGRGETVAYAGTTGWSTGCHLHFTILRDGTPVDPAPLLG